jgi:hypothetical protein
MPVVRHITNSIPAQKAQTMKFGLNNPQISDFMQNYGDFSRVLLQDLE